MKQKIKVFVTCYWTTVHDSVHNSQYLALPWVILLQLAPSRIINFSIILHPHLHLASCHLLWCCRIKFCCFSHPCFVWYVPQSSNYIFCTPCYLHPPFFLVQTFYSARCPQTATIYIYETKLHIQAKHEVKDWYVCFDI